MNTNASEWIVGEDTLFTGIYTDGYVITSTMVLGLPGTVNSHGGMCFGVDAATNGGYCHIYETGAIGGELLISGHYIKWLSATQWSDTTYDEA